ncbi:hypothetical protein KW782_01605 [Candidatus Parcubacteria bacterium]|nr:hypothetical protein [Candidatus Parcubacteria bacterium]
MAALAITVTIFIGAFFISQYLNERKTSELKAIEDKIAIDILSFETQFDIFEESSCLTFNKSSIRSELQSLDQKLIFLEGQVGANDPEVFRLKRYYSLLQIRDYLLTKRMSEQCNFDTVFLLYFYSHENCPECQTQEYILRSVRDNYPQVEIYTFDYDVDLSAIRTLINLHNIPNNPPIIDINGKLYAPFKSFADIEVILKPLL